MRNFVYIDTTTKRIKTSSHAVFDEAHYSQPTRPRGAKILIQQGMPSSLPQNDSKPISFRPPVKSITSFTVEPSNNLLVSLAHPEAIIPKQATTKAAGYDLYSVDTAIIQPGCMTQFHTGVHLQFPRNTYGRIASRSGLAIKYGITTEGGVIDPDYTGEIIVILQNTSKNAYTVTSGDRIAQLILEKFVSPPTQEVLQINNTERGNNGFGSTGINSIQMTPTKALQACDLTMSLNEPCDIIDIVVNTNHSDPVLGFQLDKTLTVTKCIPGTPAAKVKGWRNTIQGSTLIAVNRHPVLNLKDIS